MTDPALKDGEIACSVCGQPRRARDLYRDNHGDRWDICATGTCADKAGVRADTDNGRTTGGQ